MDSPDPGPDFGRPTPPRLPGDRRAESPVSDQPQASPGSTREPCSPGFPGYGDPDGDPPRGPTGDRTASVPATR
ncbi:MAG: hypothetical protein FJ379_08100 [Verrucomicrobia bacterium]|nr:hypothetical protein [Verrucomicrobiota bacterium]